MQDRWMKWVRTGIIGTVFVLLLPRVGVTQSVVADVSPSRLIRLTGVFTATDHTTVSAFPLLIMWVNGQRWQFRVEHVRPVFSAYQAEDQLRQVSLLGLRLIGNEQVLAALKNLQRYGQPIIIEGWLRRKPAVLTVRSVLPAPFF